MFDINPEWVTAICTFLGVIGGVGMGLINFRELRMPMPDFQVIPLSTFYDDNRFFKVIITPKRLIHPYYFSAIKSPIPLFATIETVSSEMLGGVPILGTEKITLSEPFVFNPTPILQRNQYLTKEQEVLFYYDADTIQGGNCEICLNFKAKYLPFIWSRKLVLFK